MANKNKDTKKVRKAILGFGNLTEGNLKIGKEYIDQYILNIFDDLKILNAKKGSYWFNDHVVDFGSNHYEKGSGRYKIAIGENENLLMLSYQSYEKTEIIDSRSFNVKEYIDDSKSIFEIFKKERQISFLEKILKLKKYPSPRFLEQSEYLSPENSYLRGTNYKLSERILHLALESSNFCSGKLEMETQNEFKIDIENKKDLLTAGREIEKQMTLLRKEYNF